MTTIGSGLFRLFLAAVVVVHHSFPLRLGGLGGLRLLYLERLLDFSDVAPTVCSHAKSAPDLHGQPMVAAGASFSGLHRFERCFQFSSAWGGFAARREPSRL